ncbi:MAG: hypothetical protein FWC51_04335, partial [Proteobacteria bacterium]|nr:hypothetical protein [Pseudomonadota bacterium]
TNILLMHHRDHDFFKQFGGHAEGNRNLPTVAKKELFQESGGIRAEPVFPNPFDLIVWRMPARLRRTDGLFYPEHDVYDIAFLFIVPDAVKFDVNRNEGFAIKWLSLTEFRDMKFNPDNPTFKNNPQNVQYNERIYEKLMILKKKLKNL